MTTTPATLVDSYQLGPLRLPNRIVMSPMTRVRSGPEGLATVSMAAYYAQRASAGLLISEGIQPSLLGQSNPLTPGLFTDAQSESWRQVTGAVHVNPSHPASPAPTSRKTAEHFLSLGADLISFGRVFLANPDLVERLRADLPLDEADEATYYAGGDTGYLTYTAYRR